jgi:cell division protein FtsI (penicillin-binding protein 3)
MWFVEMMEKPAALTGTQGRRYFILGLLLLATLGIVCRASYLQLIQKDFLQARGAERHLRVVPVSAHRGMILDRHGEPLAVSSPVDSVWVDPKSLLPHAKHINALASLLGMKTSALQNKLQRRKVRRFVYLRRHVSPELAHQIKAMQLQGVHLRREHRRYYPTSEVSAHLLGFTNIDDIGQEGLELVYNDHLHGVPGKKRIIQDLRGRSIEDIESLQMPEPGKSLRLTIDRRIQYLAYRALKAAFLKHRANSASAIVVDVASGEILALVNQPAANPNDRSDRNAQLLRNRAVTDLYEPGSTLKPFTIAMALESSLYQPHTPIDTRPGSLKVGGKLVKDIHDYGLINVSQVISKSSNVGTSLIALSLPAESLWDVYQKLGFGKVSGLGFPGERRGILQHSSFWSLIGHANHAFGYGLAVTTLQLAQAYAVIAADGVRRPLSIVHDEYSFTEDFPVFSSATARSVRTMLELAVTQQGTGYRAAVPGYRVAGKTGTVRKVKDGRYLSGRYQSIFAGMAPASRPRLVVVVMIDDPRQGDYYGGKVVAPIFSNIMAGALRVLNIAPDALPMESATLANAAAQENEP